MNRVGPEKEKTIKEKIITNVRNIFKLKRENKAIKDRIIRDIRNLLSKKKIITNKSWMQK